MTDSNKFQVPAILTRVASLKDGGLSLGFSTQELNVQEKVTVFSFYQQFGWVLFQENEFKEEDLPKGDATDEGKSPSRRLRAVLFLLWERRRAEQETTDDFEMFYRRKMEQLINEVKKLLP